MPSPYAHFLGGAAADLETKDCLYVIRCSISESPIGVLDILEELFGQFGQKISRVEVVGNDLKLTRGRVAKFRKPESVLQSVRTTHDIVAMSASFTPTHRSPLDKTWFAETYVVIHRYGQTINFGIYSNAVSWEVFNRVIDLSARWNALSVGRFQFPIAMSPIGYMAAVGVSPGYKAMGEFSLPDLERLTNFRKNCRQGKANFGSPFREVYTENFISLRGGDEMISLLQRADLIVEEFSDYFLRVTPNSSRSMEIADNMGLTLSGLPPNILAGVVAERSTRA